MEKFTYIGTELELFAKATNWKSYLKSLMKPYLKGHILEVGAGMGSNTVLLTDSPYQKWLCLEPDAQLFQVLKSTIELNHISNCSAIKGTIDSLEKKNRFDSILYLDVLEHIEDDRTELLKAFECLEVGGYLIIVGPAHQWLFTPFDAAIGHYRRYNKMMLESLLSEEMKVIDLLYLDCVGLLASLANKLVLKQSKPTIKQIKTWDRLMVPLSTKIDPILRHQLGKSIILVIQK